MINAVKFLAEIFLIPLRCRLGGHSKPTRYITANGNPRVVCLGCGDWWPATSKDGD